MPPQFCALHRKIYEKVRMRRLHILSLEQRELTVPLPEALMAGFVHMKLPTLLLMLELPGFLTPCREEMGDSQIESLGYFSDCA